MGAAVTGSGPSYSTVWNTATAANGNHTVAAVAKDAAGNTASSGSVAVTVNNATPPVVSLTAPGNGGNGERDGDGDG